MKNGEKYLRDVTNITRNISVRIMYVLSIHMGVHRSSLVQDHTGYLPSNLGRALFDHIVLGEAFLTIIRTSTFTLDFFQENIYNNNHFRLTICKQVEKFALVFIFANRVAFEHHLKFL